MYHRGTPTQALPVPTNGPTAPTVPSPTHTTMTVAVITPTPMLATLLPPVVAQVGVFATPRTQLTPIE